SCTFWTHSGFLREGNFSPLSGFNCPRALRCDYWAERAGGAGSAPQAQSDEQPWRCGCKTLRGLAGAVGTLRMNASSVHAIAPGDGVIREASMDQTTITNKKTANGVVSKKSPRRPNEKAPDVGSPTELQELLLALRAMRSGDFSVRMGVEHDGLLG